jgi:hypothetical protein
MERMKNDPEAGQRLTRLRGLRVGALPLDWWRVAAVLVGVARGAFVARLRGSGAASAVPGWSRGGFDDLDQPGQYAGS